MTNKLDFYFITKRFYPLKFSVVLGDFLVDESWPPIELTIPGESYFTIKLAVGIIQINMALADRMTETNYISSPVDFLFL